MKLLTVLLILIFIFPITASALEFTAPAVPEAGAAQMPEDTASFGEGLQELLRNMLLSIRPDIREALRAGVALTAAVMMVSLLSSFSGNVVKLAQMAGVIIVASMLLSNADTMISLGAETVRELSEYGKLLCPVLTAAAAAQGGITSSAALYAGTAGFDMILSSIIAGLLVPGVYLFLALSVGNAAMGEDALKKLRELIKSAISWCLKILLTVFTTYMSITGVVSGTTDAAALKATKITISSVVPVVGGILSDASEAVLVSAGLAKNAAGIYGILAILAVFLRPFSRIAMQYLTLKGTAAVCGIFGPKPMTGLIDDFSTAMGLLLAMTGSVCLMLLISTVCFMKGVG